MISSRVITLNVKDVTLVLQSSTPGLGYVRASSLMMLVSHKQVIRGFRRRDWGDFDGMKPQTCSFLRRKGDVTEPKHLLKRVAGFSLGLIVPWLCDV